MKKRAKKAKKPSRRRKVRRYTIKGANGIRHQVTEVEWPTGDQDISF